MDEYNVITSKDSVHICKDCGSVLKSFVDIYTEDKNTKSPFRSVDDAKLFAEIIVKLLVIAYDFKR